MDIGKQIEGLDPAALEILERHHWPGNVRELQHTIDRAVVLTTEPLLHAHLFDREREAAASRADLAADHASEMAMHHLPPGAVVLTSFDVGDAERILIERALIATGGNRTHAAKLLGISARTLRKKVNVRPSDVEVPRTERSTASD
jgi:DNA-binding NtrC family response regulator